MLLACGEQGQDEKQARNQEQDPRVGEEVDRSVGVYFFTGGDDVLCPDPRWGTVNFVLDNEDEGVASSVGRCQGWHWALPEVQKDLRGCGVGERLTRLNFCHVNVPDGTFRPLTTNPEDEAQFYAVLRLGDECPKNSVQVTKAIANYDPADVPNENLMTSVTPALGQNISDPLGHLTRLVFCFFRWAEHAGETMQEVPDLGVHYAVFHDFDVAQPAWVSEKRWILTDDSNGTKENSYWPSAPDPVHTEFVKLVEDVPAGRTRDTCFDLARVR
jgi:hypothetical protein